MPIPEDTSPISRACLRDEVYETLLDWVVQGKLQPGEKIRDNELAAHLGVSRTPVREALRRLQDKALVEAAASRWTRVSAVTIEEAEQIYPIIISLEQLALELALPNLKRGVLRRMQAVNTQLENSLAAKNSLEASQADAKFHQVMVDAAGNAHLSEMLADLKLRHRRLEVIYFGGCLTATESVAEHARLVEALTVGEIAPAREFIKIHWQLALSRLRASAEQLD